MLKINTRFNAKYQHAVAHKNIPMNLEVATNPWEIF